MSSFLKQTTRSYHGMVLGVSWDVAVAFNSLGVEHLLLISQDDETATLLKNIVSGFFAHRQLPLFALHVLVGPDDDSAAQLAAVVVPQVRYYCDAVEVSRHRGTVTYEVLSDLLDTSE